MQSLWFLPKEKISPLISSWSKKISANLPNKPTDINQQVLLKLNRKKIPTWQQIKQLPKVLNPLEKIQLNTALIVLILAVITLGWRFYMTTSQTEASRGGSYTEGLIGSPNLINPILATSDVDRDLARLIYAGLMKFDENGNLIPDLASAYNIDASQKIYTFELRPNLKWHNGENITAEDVIFTFNSLKNPEFKSPYRTSFNGVNVSKVDDVTVQFTLDKPMSSFLSLLTIGLVPEHLWYSIPAVGAPLSDLNIKPIRAGPYKFKSLTRDSSGNIKNYNLTAYNDYHNNTPFINDLTFKFYPDYETAVTALQNKNVEGLIYLPNQYKNTLASNSLKLYNLHFPQYTAVFFNPANNSLLNDVDFRRALALAIDKDRILNEVLNGDGQTLATPILPGTLGFDSELKAENHSPDKAKELLEKLGWHTSPDHAFRVKTNKNAKADDPVEELSIKLTTIDQSDNTKIISLIKEAWESIGIKTELEIISKDRIRQDVIETRNYQALVFGEVLNNASGPYPFWHSSQTKYPGLNLSIFSNKEIDRNLEIARGAGDDTAKIEALKNFQKKLLELNYSIILYNPTYTYPTASKIKGLDSLQFINAPADRFNNINTWYIKTKRVLKKTN